MPRTLEEHLTQNLAVMLKTGTPDVGMIVLLFDWLSQRSCLAARTYKAPAIGVILMAIHVWKISELIISAE